MHAARRQAAAYAGVGQADLGLQLLHALLQVFSLLLSLPAQLLQGLLFLAAQGRSGLFQGSCQLPCVLLPLLQAPRLSGMVMMTKPCWIGGSCVSRTAHGSLNSSMWLAAGHQDMQCLMAPGLRLEV